MGQHDAEELRVFNARYEPIGTASRGRVHREGLWHETFHCWIVRGSADGGGRMLLQRRSAAKRVWPSRLDATAGGHVAPGERPKAGVLREMDEEIGITVDPARLIPLGVRVGIDEFVDGIKNHELLSVFLTRLDSTPAAWRLQASEVDALLEARLHDLLRLFSGEIEHAPAEEIAVPDEREAETVQLTLSDFPETLDDYYYKVAILADRLLRSDRHLRI